MSRRAIRRLGQGDHPDLLALTGRHRFAGALLEHLAALLGLDGDFACSGPYESDDVGDFRDGRDSRRRPRAWSRGMRPGPPASTPIQVTAAAVLLAL